MPCLVTRYTHLSNDCELKAFNLQGGKAEEKGREGREEKGE